MRKLINVVALVCACVGLVVIGHRYLDRQTQDSRIEQTQQALSRIRQEIRRQASLGATPLSSTGWPKTLSPEWFGGTPPQSALFDRSRPWLEVATEDQAWLTNPTVRCDAADSFAQFWYNPALGIVRARVPYGLNDEETLVLYNSVNQTELESIFPRRMPSSGTSAGVVPSDDP